LVKNTNKKIKSSDGVLTPKIILICILTCVLILGIVISLVFFTSTDTSSTDTSSTDTSSTDTSSTDTSSTDTSSTDTMIDYIEDLSKTHTYFVSQKNPNFDFYLTENDYIRHQNGFTTPLDGVKINFKDSMTDDYFEKLKSNHNSVVIFPIFTSMAYNPDGFYSYYAGQCDTSCIIDLSMSQPKFDYNSGGFTAQILFELGYEFLTDIDVDKNPQLLENYETVILLHNEYVTKSQFDSISSHSNLIFLHPNALYAEIDVNYDTNTITLIRGHNYPSSEIANGFDYAIEEKFHEYEYDRDCLNWKFVEIENGYHLNCYPDAIITDNLEILIKLNELLNK